MYIVGLTGNVAAGKSTVCDLFAKKDVRVIDADGIAHQLFAQQETQTRIGEAFGAQAMTNGVLDRNKLRTCVFTYLPHLRTLEVIVHQSIRTQIAALLNEREAHNAPYVIVAVPLLFETGWNHLCDASLFVRCDLEKRKERLVDRGLDAQSIDTLLGWQMPEEISAPYSDYQLDNNGSLDTLNRQVEQLHQALSDMARDCTYIKRRLSF